MAQRDAEPNCSPPGEDSWEPGEKIAFSERKLLALKALAAFAAWRKIRLSPGDRPRIFGCSKPSRSVRRVRFNTRRHGLGQTPATRKGVVRRVTTSLSKSRGRSANASRSSGAAKAAAHVAIIHMSSQPVNGLAQESEKVSTAHDRESPRVVQLPWRALSGSMKAKPS
jgi:hypothetical protein